MTAPSNPPRTDTFTARALSELAPEAIAAAYNVAYADYVVPFTVDAAWASNNGPRHDVDPAASYVWYTESEEVAALSVLGVRGHEGWIGGFGIAPALRGNGLSRWLIEQTIASARAAHVHNLWLEVITTNLAAIRVYERAGFTHTRELLVLRAPSAPGSGVAAQADAEAESHGAHAPHLTPFTLAAAAERRGVSGDRAAWQRSLPRVAFEPENVLNYAAWDLASANGGLITTGSGAARRLSDIWAEDSDSAARLLATVRDPFVSYPALLLNEPEDSAVAHAALAAGWTEVLTQDEMLLTLA